jgi:NADH:ubiquinone oxidoreductase subunit 3 (subunit A)
VQASYLPLLVFFSGGILFIALGFGMSLLLQKRKPNAQKSTFYECGEDAGPAGSQFNLRFGLAALVFVLMEVEIVLLAPVLLNRFEITAGSMAESESLLKTEILVSIVDGLTLSQTLSHLTMNQPALLFQLLITLVLLLLLVLLLILTHITINNNICFKSLIR